MQHTLRWITWELITILAWLLVLITGEYLSFTPDHNFLEVKQDLVHDSIWRPTFYIHVFSGMLIMLIGPFQFLEVFRNKYMKWHRAAGKIYVYGILVLAAPTGVIMAFYAEGGLWSSIGFLIMGVLWFVTTLMAVIKIKQHKIEEHRIWMMRSYALSLAAVTLRLLVPLFSEIFPNREQLVIVSTAWLSWLLNLLIAEGMIFALHRKTNKLKITT